MEPHTRQNYLLRRDELLVNKTQDMYHYFLRSNQQPLDMIYRHQKRAQGKESRPPFIHQAGMIIGKLPYAYQGIDLYAGLHVGRTDFITGTALPVVDHHLQNVNDESLLLGGAKQQAWYHENLVLGGVLGVSKQRIKRRTNHYKAENTSGRFHNGFISSSIAYQYVRKFSPQAKFDVSAQANYNLEYLPSYRESNGWR